MKLNISINSDMEFKLRQLSKKRNKGMNDIAKELLEDWILEDDMVDIQLNESLPLMDSRIVPIEELELLAVELLNKYGDEAKIKIQWEVLND